VSDGTEALYLALRACNVGPGDEVITVSHTFFATTEAIVQVGAVPVYVDVDEDTMTMNVDQIESVITPKTKAILPVHLYGYMADMDSICAIAEKHGLRVIEDAAQAHGARRNGKYAGTIGDIGTFSFYCSKNLGAYGEAGGVVTNNDTFAGRVARLRDHGSMRKYHHDEVGVNGRLDEIQAAVLRLKLPGLDEGNRKRRMNARMYHGKLLGLPITTPSFWLDRDHVFHVYVIRTPQRDALQAHLKALGISTGIHCPIANHQQHAMKMHEWRSSGDLSVTEKVVDEILSLPMFPELSEGEIERVCDGVRGFFR